MGELLDSISSEELTEWAAYYQLDPFGDRRGDMQAAVVASTMANIHAKKGHRFAVSDFMPTYGEAPSRTPMSPSEIHARLEMMMRARRRG